jgi:transcriptional regulator with XRE-family HTH domain
MDAAELLRSVRRAAGLSQRALAERAGTSAAAVCQYERGERIPRVDTLRRLLAAAGADLRLEVATRAGIDVEANAQTLEQLLELADNLPRRTEEELRCPVFRDLAA